MRSFLAELDRRDRVLALAGWFFVALLLLMLIAAAVDHREVLGLNPWIKPIKFAVSIAIYLWTLAWLFGELPGAARAKAFIRRGATVSMIAEIACIAGQALRGTASHFNHTTPLDGAIFTLMGLFILFNTLLESLLLALFFQRGLPLPPAYLWGIRLGLLGSLLSAAVGAAMIAHDAHTVGAPDGGPGLWLVNWSTEAGDLRVAHAVSLHALQVLTVAGYAFGRVAAPRTGTLAIGLISLVYLGVAGWLFAEALQGQPLLGHLQ